MPTTDISASPTASGSASLDAAQTNLNPTRAEAAYQELKRRIVMIELAPGAQFREADVAASLGLGKTPVREALLRLSLEGLVQLQSRSGYTVAPITLKGARDTCELRALLEGEAAEHAASARGGAGEVLVDQAARGVMATGRPDMVAQDAQELTTWLEAERGFHLALGRASGNELLTKTLAGLLEGFSRVCYLACALGNGLPLPPHDHRALAEAISAGKPDEARAMAVEEVRAAEVRLIEALISSEALSTTNVEPRPGARPQPFYLSVPAGDDK